MKSIYYLKIESVSVLINIRILIFSSFLHYVMSGNSHGRKLKFLSAQLFLNLNLKLKSLFGFYPFKV